MAQRQRFERSATELAFLEHCSPRSMDWSRASRRSTSGSPARDQRGGWWPTVARLRCFRGIETLTALVVLSRSAEFDRFQRARPLSRPGSAWCPRSTSPAEPPPGRHHQNRLRAMHDACWSRPPGITCASPGSASTVANRQQRASPHTFSRSLACPTPAVPPHGRRVPARQAGERQHGRGRTRARLLPLGRRHRRLTTATAAVGRSRRRATAAGHTRFRYGQPKGATPVPRKRTPGERNQGTAVANPRIIRLKQRPSTEPDAPPPEQPPPTPRLSRRNFRTPT